MPWKPIRKERIMIVRQNQNDVYREKEKPPAHTVCMKCGSVFQNGRWGWESAESAMGTEICPACRRIRDRLPAGQVDIKGAFYKQHAQEVLNRVRNIENLEKGRHPLERIMTIRQDAESATIATTGIHLARRIGEGISDSFNGKLKVTYLRKGDSVRVYWER